MSRGRSSAPLAAVCAMVAIAVLLAGCAGGEKPQISSITPAGGAAGTRITVEGSAFGAEQGNSTVEFGTVTAQVSTWSDGRITLKVPGGLEPGEYEVTVVTPNGPSGGIAFRVTREGDEQDGTPDRKQGQIEHNTPVQAILDYCKKKGTDTTGMTFSVVIVSKSDPDWKIDRGYRANTGADMFVLHNVNGKWTVVDDGANITAEDLAKLGAPADLLPPPQPGPHPNTQAQAVLGYLQSRGMPADGWQLVVAKVSREDSSWEVVTGRRDGRTDNFLMVWNNMAGGWEVLADGGPPWTGVDFKGASPPADLNTL